MFILHLMANFQLPGSKQFDTQMSVNTETQNTDVSLEQEFQKHSSNESLQTWYYIDNGKKDQLNKSRQTRIIMYNIIKIPRTRTWKCIVPQNSFPN